MRYLIILLFPLLSPSYLQAAHLLIPMDGSQKNHLKAYGLAYYILKADQEVDWLLNYRGGSFLIKYAPSIENECIVRGISFEVLQNEKVNSILKEISSPSVNMDVVRMAKAPRIAVYSPKNELVNDETDAVILVLDYAEIPYQIIYDQEILSDELVKYDWLHLHHEDFTGQHGRFLRRESAIVESKLQETLAHQLGYAKVSQMKLDVAKKIKGFCAGGGYLFAMCSGAETFDIALAAEGVDINESMYDGDEPDPQAQSKLDFKKTLAFENFTLEPGDSRKFSDINTGHNNFYEQRTDFFNVFDFSAKWDMIPSLLTQNHEHVIREFMGQTMAFNKYLVKPDVLVLGENHRANNVRYIYGELGRGHWTYYSGHDPEGIPGRWREPTDLNLYPHSPGYRLILNNVLFPSAKKKKQKT
ncbi:MAG TPA: asparagine synthetase B [Cyclobacteriaceae bacterium]